jgi:hypothetical protein
VSSIRKRIEALKKHIAADVRAKKEAEFRAFADGLCPDELRRVIANSERLGTARQEAGFPEEIEGTEDEPEDMIENFRFFLDTAAVDAEIERLKAIKGASNAATPNHR